MHSANTILNRLKQTLNLDSDVDLAKFMGKNPSTISTWRRRDSLDYPLILAKCKDHKLDLNEVFWGQETGSPSVAKEETTSYSSTTELEKENERLKAQLEVLKEMLLKIKLHQEDE